MDTERYITLWYGAVLVGHVRSVFCSEETWYGTLASSLNQTDDGIVHRLVDYIDFCVDWNERTNNDRANPPDANEFDKYADIVKSGLWTTNTESGETTQIADAPVFFSRGEISWRAAT